MCKMITCFMFIISPDVLSISGFEGASRSSTASLRDSIHGENFVTIQHASSIDNSQSISVILHCCSGAHVSYSDDIDANVRLNNVEKPIFVNEISSPADGTVGKDEGLLDNCGIIPSNCLPCLASTVPPVEKRSSLCSSPPSARKRVTSKLSFRWREGHANSNLCK